MRITDTHVYFWRGKFSNWHPCLIKDSGFEFSNSEQLYMWKKATFFKDKEIGDQILNTKDPKTAKELARKISNFNNDFWDHIKFSAMFVACYAKFSQNTLLKQDLLNTKSKILVEASPYDEIWGVGLAEEDDLILREENWRGSNLLGKVLMQVRGLLYE